jgi:cytochrome c-type biogenesis protein CcmH
MMLFWCLFALMTGVAIFSVLWPLSRQRRAGVSAQAADMAVYQDQLAEIKNDRARGLIADSEAEAARIEVARRLLAASDETVSVTAKSGSLNRRRMAAVLALAGIPAIAISLYLAVGSPTQPAAPLAARMAKPTQPQDIAMLLGRVEAHLAEKPNDGRGWELLAPIYMRMGRTADAVKARTNALRILGPTADREADLGEALVANANGVVTADASAAFDRALSLDSHQEKARFFRGLAAEQDGRKGEAEKIWQDMAAGAPADAPWLPAVRAALDRLKSDTQAK